MKFLKKLLKNTIIFFVLLIVILIVYVFSDVFFKYVIHGKSFYLVSVGDKEYKKGNYSEAIENYNKAIKLYPKHIKARYNLANIYVNFEDFQSAVKEYEKVLEYKPDFLNARINLGIVLSEELMDFDRAIKEYKKVTETKTRFINIPLIYDNRKHILNAKAVAYYNLGLAYRDKSMLFAEDSQKYRNLLLKAANSYEKALALKPDNYNSRFNLALTNHLLGHYSEAIKNYCEALLLSPLDYEAHYNLAVLLKEKKLYKQSFEEFKNAGSLMGYSGQDAYRSRYIHSMLGEVSQMAVAKYGDNPDGLYRKFNEEIKKDNSIDMAKFKTLKAIEKELIKKIRYDSICKKHLNNH